jgi:HSP20 family protein
MNMRKNDDDKKGRPWDDVFGGFDEEFEEMRAKMNQLMEHLTNGSAPRDNEPIIHGFSMRFGPYRKARIQQFGSTAAGSEEPSTREPLTDVIEEEEKVRVVVELPGVEKEDIHLHATAKTLDIEINNEDHGFSKHLDLPCEVKAGNAKANYKNGVLQILLDRTTKRKRKKEIKIE